MYFTDFDDYPKNKITIMWDASNSSSENMTSVGTQRGATTVQPVTTATTPLSNLTTGKILKHN